MNLNNLAKFILPETLYKHLVSSDLARRITRGTFWSIVKAIVLKGASFVQAIVLARILGIAAFGEWGILLSTVGTVGVFTSFGFNVTATKHVAEWYKTNPKRLARLLGLLQLAALSLGGIVFLVLFLGAQPIAENVLNASQLSQALIVVGVIVLLNGISQIYIGILSGLEKFREKAIIHTVTTPLGVLLTIVLAYYYGVIGAVFGLALTSILTVAVSGVWVYTLFKKLGISLYKKQPLEEWRGIRDFALPTTITNALVMIAVYAAHIALIRQPGGYEEMGAYQAANQWRGMVSFLPTQMLSAYLPIISSLLDTNRDQLIKLQHKTLITVLSLTLAICIPVMFLSPWIMSLYGQDFMAFWPVLVFLVIIAVFDIGHIVFHKTAVAHGYVWVLSMSNLAIVGAAVLGIFWLIPEYLGVGLALTLILGYAGRMAIEYLIFRYKTNSLKV